MQVNRYNILFFLLFSYTMISVHNNIDYVIQRWYDDNIDDDDDDADGDKIMMMIQMMTG